MSIVNQRQSIEQESGNAPPQSLQSVVGLSGTPGQGPHMVLLLHVQDDTIQEARFSTYGCPAAVACGQWITNEVEGKSITETRNITEAALLVGTGPMPLGREHCPALAISALQDALNKWDIADKPN